MDEKAVELVERLNQELWDRFGEDAAAHFVFTTDGLASAITFGDNCVWNSEGDSSYDDDDNEIPLESHVRTEMVKLAETINYIAFPKCCDLDCMGEGGANACVETLDQKGS